MSQTEKSEQRFIIKFSFMKGLSANKTRTKLTAVLGPTAFSLRQVKEWRASFGGRRPFMRDKFRADRSLHILGRLPANGIFSCSTPRFSAFPRLSR
jgi:hypothetical protein